MNDYDYEGIEFTLLHQTEKAVLVRDTQGDFWVPKSLFKNARVRADKLTGFLASWFNRKYLLKEEQDNDFEPLDADGIDDYMPEIIPERTEQDAQEELNSVAERNKEVEGIFG